MNQGAFEEDVLGFVCDDFEAPRTIASDIARELGRPITEVEVRGALLSLAAKGQVQAYIFDKARNRYVPVGSAAAMHEADPWFLATPKFGGRAP